MLNTQLKTLWFTLLLVVMASLGLQAQVAIPAGLPELKTPILITSCGQSPGGVYIKVVCRQLKYEAELVETATANDLSTKPYKTVFMITGTSLKGLGSAGVNLDSEIKRCETLVKKAKEAGIKVVVAQIEGPSRRSDESDERSIRSMTPLGDVLITHKGVDHDGYFTKTAAEKKIPQIFINQQMELLKVLPQIIKK